MLIFSLRLIILNTDNTDTYCPNNKGLPGRQAASRRVLAAPADCACLIELEFLVISSLSSYHNWRCVMHSAHSAHTHTHTNRSRKCTTRLWGCGLWRCWRRVCVWCGEGLDTVTPTLNIFFLYIAQSTPHKALPARLPQLTQLRLEYLSHHP